MELYKFLSGIIYKIGIRDGFLFENPEFSFKSPILFVLLFLGFYFLKILRALYMLLLFYCFF